MVSRVLDRDVLAVARRAWGSSGELRARKVGG